MISTLSKFIAKGDEQAERLSKAIISSRGNHPFRGPYTRTKAWPDALIASLVQSKDPEIIEEFRSTLAGIGDDRAKADLARLPQVSSGSRQALAADDSRSMCAMHRAILTDLGFTPFMASNGEEAYDYIEGGQEFDVIITDMNMPVMDGMELVVKIRNTPHMKNVPIIMVTTGVRGLPAGPGLQDRRDGIHHQALQAG